MKFYYPSPVTITQPSWPPLSLSFSTLKGEKINLIAPILFQGAHFAFLVSIPFILSLKKKEGKKNQFMAPKSYCLYTVIVFYSPRSFSSKSSATLKSLCLPVNRSPAAPLAYRWPSFVLTAHAGTLLLLGVVEAPMCRPLRTPPPSLLLCEAAEGIKRSLKIAAPSVHHALQPTPPSDKVKSLV